MNYTSTRDNAINVKSSEAIAKGLSPEGGLFVPNSIPVISQNNIKFMADMTYTQRAKEILGRFLINLSSWITQYYLIWC